jgi:DNA-directed RNA polymerase subunit RPC12/RpoP
MKYNLLERIVSHIKQDVLCPKCQKTISNDSMEIVFTKQNEVEFQLECDACGSKVKLLAQVTEQTAKGIFPKKQRKFFSPDLAQKISESMKNFHGQDVNDLFKK